jgi:hypothetical protein
MRSLRQWHQYLSLFFAPSIFVFALSGFIQVTGFHESHPGSTYKPPGWIVVLANIHQKQVATHAPDMMPDDDAPPGKPHTPHGPPPSFVPLKPFVLLMALGLMATSLLGSAIALTNRNSRNVSLAVLIAGTVLPLLLLLV